jgi:succinyl-diaminopimelate desuccinylase
MDKTMMKQTLWNLVQRESSELVKLCSKLIRIPSENPPATMGPIIDFICAYLKKCGIRYEVVGPDKEHPSIVATLGEGSGLLFNGHCDVVPVGERSKWSFDPFGGEITQTSIRGRGASDMKCGLAGVLFAMRLAAHEKLPIKGSIVLHVVPDEETGGQYGTKWLVANGYAEGAIACIVAEPTSSNNCEVGQKGSVKVKLKARGKSAHGSIGNYVGENAIRKTVTILGRIEELREMTGRYTESQARVLLNSKLIAAGALKAPNVGDVIDHVTVNIGTIKGGSKLNMVADYCETEIDIRVPIGLPSQRVIDRLKMIGRGIDGIEYDITHSEANYTEDTEPLVQAVLRTAEQVWGHPVIPAYQWASSDARYYREKGIPTVQYGPSNTVGIHSYNEDVDIEDVIDSSKVYIGTIIDLLCVSNER